MLIFLFFPDVMLKPYQGTRVVSLAFSHKKKICIFYIFVIIGKYLITCDDM